MLREFAIHGDDYNRNGIRDAGEPVSDGGFDRGLSAYLTVYSREQNTDSLGQDRVLVLTFERPIAALVVDMPL